MVNKFVIKNTKPKITIGTTKATKLDIVVSKPIIDTKRSKAFFKLKNTGGPAGEKGEKGDPGQAATIAAGTATSLPSGSTPTVTNTGTSSAAVFNFGIPKGDKGDKGDTGSAGSAATVAVGTTSTGAAGTNASVTNAGTSSAAVFNFTIPKGDKGDKGDTGSAGAAATISVGTVTTGAEGSDATVTNSGTSSAAVFDFTIPRGAAGATGSKGDKGDQGDAATISVGTTTTGAAGTNASVTNSGTTGAAVLDFTIPRGSKGDKGDKGDTGATGSAATITVGSVTTGAPGTSASVVNSGTSGAAVLDFTIPRGDKGEAGSGAGDMLAADYDPNGTVQNAGGIVDYVDGVLPTVNNATLTIQKNGSNVQTFTANQSSNATANITVPTKTSDLLNDGADNTAAYLETDETAYKTTSIPYGQCDNTSTATVFTATVPGITELRDGVCMWLKNGVVTSASGFTININGLGAKPVYNNMAAATRDTTLWNANYTMLFVYDSTRVAGGCWVLYRGYNSDNNTIGYQLRTNSQSLPMSSIVYRYRLLFTSADGTHYVPANNSTSTNNTSSRTVCQDKINPFGRIFYYGATASVAANARPAATSLWEQYAIALGYSFNRTGAALTLTSWKPVYLKCAPQTDGSAIIDSTTPYVQDLPTTEDGKIYVFLGIAYSATNIELQVGHPVYYYKDGVIRPWTNATAGISSVAWGDITGTLSSQTDLNTALGAKANSADLATVATSGSYNDLSDKPTIPAAQVNSDWNANSGVAQILNKPSLATVATTGAYSDLTGTPTIPAAQVNSDWNANSGVAQILNKPTIPTVNDATLTIQKNGTTVNTFTANASSNVTANITVPTAVTDLSDARNYVTQTDIADVIRTTDVGVIRGQNIADSEITSSKIDWTTQTYTVTLGQHIESYSEVTVKSFGGLATIKGFLVTNAVVARGEALFTISNCPDALKNQRITTTGKAGIPYYYIDYDGKAFYDIGTVPVGNILFGVTFI